MRALKVSSGMRARMIWLGGVAAASAMSLAAYLLPGSAISTAFAQEVAYFRIGAGTPGSTLYDLAGQIAGAISNPPGSRQCDNGGPCGVEGLIGLAQTTMAPAEGLQSVEDGMMESAIVSADIAADAAEGTGPFKKSGAMTELRAIANVGQMVLHVLVAKEARFEDVASLKGKRIAIGIEGSDNAITARFLLRAAGLSDKKTKLLTGDPDAAAQDVLNDKADALVVVAQLPSADVASLMRTGNYRLLAAQLSNDNQSSYVAADRIPQREYSAAETPTLSVPAIWVVNATLSRDLADGLVKALWHSAAQSDEGATPGTIDVNIDHLSVPLHPGAKAAFTKLGMAEPIETPPAEPQPTTN
ncbi:TAXI family TRAP transporter solute-binding subunit [Dongia deserti]|uniref:TAXI family TRAP transporter solute-binding subunit n=1 Tax=Dongia deserti TaxID=2268030 RepID=UPI0013C43F62|nr:TAXI family TRAP transporter solute-binding subunit [Dongia deserti]